MSRSVRAGTGLVVAFAAVWACALSAGAAEPVTLEAEYTGFTVVERTECTGGESIGMVCFDLRDNDTHIDVLIEDDFTENIMGLLSYHYPNGESKYMQRFCGIGTFEIDYDERGPADYIVVSIEPHGFGAGCTFNPADMPVRGRVTVTLS